MLIRDIMKTNVLTIPSSASLAEAKKTMEDHHILRMPVVDRGKLVGIITNRRLDKYTPSKISTLSVWELGYMLNKITVKEVMERNVLTCSPDTTAEEALALAQSHKVGALVIVENDKVVGISTTNDFFYSIVNPILGLGEGGCRIEIKGGGEGQQLEQILHIVNSRGIAITNVYIYKLPEAANSNAILHLACDNCEETIQELTAKGFNVNLRKR